MSICSKRLASLASKIHFSFTKPRGFRKRGNTLWHLVEHDVLPIAQVINFQGSQGNGGQSCGFYINVGIYVADLFPHDDVVLERIKEYDCHMRSRINPVHEHIGGRWKLGTHVEAECERVTAALQREAVPFFDDHSTAEKFVEKFEELEGSKKISLATHAAAIHGRLGRPEQARAILEEHIRVLASERPRADRSRIHKLAERLGVAPLSP